MPWITDERFYIVLMRAVVNLVSKFSTLFSGLHRAIWRTEIWDVLDGLCVCHEENRGHQQ